MRKRKKKSPGRIFDIPIPTHYSCTVVKLHRVEQNCTNWNRILRWRIAGATLNYETGLFGATIVFESAEKSIHVHHQRKSKLNVCREVRKKEMEEMRADGNNMKHYRSQFCGLSRESKDQILVFNKGNHAHYMYFAKCILKCTEYSVHCTG